MGLTVEDGTQFPHKKQILGHAYWFPRFHWKQK